MIFARLALLVYCLIPAAMLAHEAPRGLLVHLPLDGNLSDTSGYGHSGEFIQAGGTPAAAKLQFVEGKYGGSVLFGDGTIAVRIPVDLHPKIYPRVSVTFWAYAEQEHKGGYLVANGGYAGPILWYTGPEMQAHSVRSIARHRSVFRPGRWMFIAGVWDHAAGTMRLHIGGRVVEGTYDPEAAMSANTAKADLWLGAYDDRLGRPVQGLRLDDIRIYGRVLSVEEVEALAHGSTGSARVAENADSAQSNRQVLIERASAAGDVEDSIDRQLEAAASDPIRRREAELERSRDTAMTETLIESAQTVGNVETDIESQLEAATTDPLKAGEAELEREAERLRDAAMMEALIESTQTVGNVETDIESQLEAATTDPLKAGEAELEREAERLRDAAMTEALIDGALNYGSTEENITDQIADGSYKTGEQVFDTDDRISDALGYELPTISKGYVLTHEHPTYGMAFGGNYAFAGADDNYPYGIMQSGYTAACGGCFDPDKVLGNCDHGEVKGSLVGLIDALGSDIGDHNSYMGPLRNSNSHLRYSTEWIKDAFEPHEERYKDSRMRIMVAFAVENEAMCEQLYYANKGNGGHGGDGYPCSHGDSFPSLKRQLDNIKAWAADPKNRDWMEIAYSAADARRIVESNKLAIVLGVESEYAFGAEDRTFDPVDRLNEYYDLGVRTFYLAHKINSRLAGADVFRPGDSAPGKAMRATQAIFGCFYYDDNVGHFPLEGRLGKNLCDNKTRCGANAFKGGKITDACAHRFGEISEANMTDYIMTRGGGQFNGFALYPKTPGFDGNGGTRIDSNGVERNNLGLSYEGERVVRAAMMKGMIVNIDHVSSRARDDMYELATNVFDHYPLNALHNKPNRLLTSPNRDVGVKKKDWKHEFDLDDEELGYIRDTGGFFGFRLGPTDSQEYPNSGVFGAAKKCPNTSTESAKMLAYLLDFELPVGYSLDYATNTQGVFSRTDEGCELPDIGDEIHYYIDSTGSTARKRVAEGLSHIGMMKQWHNELEAIGLKQEYVDRLKFDGVEAFLKMWEKSEAASGSGSQVQRIVIIPQVEPH